MVLNVLFLCMFFVHRSKGIPSKDSERTTSRTFLRPRSRVTSGIGSGVRTCGRSGLRRRRGTHVLGRSRIGKSSFCFRLRGRRRQCSHTALRHVHHVRGSPCDRIVARCKNNQGKHFSRRLRDRLSKLRSRRTLGRVVQRTGGGSHVHGRLRRSSGCHGHVCRQVIGCSRRKGARGTTTGPSNRPSTSDLVRGNPVCRTRGNGQMHHRPASTPKGDGLFETYVRNSRAMIANDAMQVQLLRSMALSNVGVPTGALFCNVTALKTGHLSIMIDGLGMKSGLGPMSIIIFSGSTVRNLGLPGGLGTDTTGHVRRNLMRGVSVPLSSVNAVTDRIADMIGTAARMTGRVLGVDLSRIGMRLGSGCRVCVRRRDRRSGLHERTIRTRLRGLCRRVRRRGAGGGGRPLRALVSGL